MLTELLSLPEDGTLIPKINAIAGRGGMPLARELSRATNMLLEGGYDNWPTAVKRMVNKLERMEDGGGPDGGGGGGGGKSRASRQVLGADVNGRAGSTYTEAQVSNRRIDSVLAMIIAKDADSDNRALAKALLEVAKNSGLGGVKMKTLAGSRAVFNEASKHLTNEQRDFAADMQESLSKDAGIDEWFLGAYDGVSDQVLINSAVPINSGLLLHEIAHALTVHAINSKIKLSESGNIDSIMSLRGADSLRAIGLIIELMRNNLQDLYGKVIDRADGEYSAMQEKLERWSQTGAYGLTNVHEFVAEVFGNARFRRLLEKTTPPKEYNDALKDFYKPKNLLEWVAKIFSDLLLSVLKKPNKQSALALSMGAIADLLNNVGSVRELSTPRAPITLAAKSRASRQSTEIHNSLGKEGFAATHDSPIRHEGKFNWREHSGKGEGNAAFGAGIYLSISDAVHKHYKNMFTAMINESNEVVDRSKVTILEHELSKVDKFALNGKVLFDPDEMSVWDKDSGADNPFWGVGWWDVKKVKELFKKELDKHSGKKATYKHDTSPTYHVTVNIKPEELLDWNAPFSEQSQFVQSALKTALANTPNEKVRNALNFLVNGMGRIHPDAGVTYNTLSLVLGSQAAASDYLQSLGILGHKYAAEGGRNATHPNYVIYDDSKIETNYVHFSRQGQNSQQQAPSGEANSKSKDVAVAAALADAKRRLKDAADALIQDVVLDDDGNSVSGLYTPKSETVKAVMQVARGVLSLRGSMAHENWHAVEDLLLELGPKGKHIVDTIHAAASKPETIDWIMDHLIQRGENPANSAAINQLTDPSERAAFLFQFFIETGGKLPVAPKARGYLSKIKAFLKKMMGIQDDLIKAGAFFAYFDKGTFADEMNDAEKVLAGLGETRREKFAAKVGEATKPLRKLANAAFGHAADRIRELDIPEYTDILERFQTGKGTSAGFIREHHARSYSFFNKFTRIVAGKDKLTSADEAKIAELVLEIETYKQAAGAGFDKRRTSVPPSLDPAKIEGSLDDFIYALKAWGGFPKNTKKADIDRIANEILLKGYHSGKHDVLEMHPEKFEKWLSEDKSKDAFVYIKKSTHEAEMARAFGDKTLDDLLAKGDEQADINGREMIRTYIAAAQGNSHLALSPQLRKLFGAITTGINLSILPFAVFSQMIEPLQLAFRKNDVASALNSTFRGLRDLPRTFKAVDAGAQKDQWEMMAADLGVIAEAQAVTMMSDIMNEVPMTGKLGKVNDLFFRYNGMEQWTRSMHIAATKNAVEFIKQHDKNESELGDKLLAELDLERGKIPYRADGEVDHNDPAVRAAILRFVNESMAHPDAGSNTIWMNDARFALLAHLKRFTFAHAFHINRRVINNIEDGNLRSLTPIAAMVPWMIAVDGLRDFVNPGEEAYKNNWEASDYVAKAIERSSYYGRYGLGLDFMANVERGGSGIEAAAPSAEMASKIARGFGQGRGTDAIMDAMPVSGW